MESRSANDNRRTLPSPVRHAILWGLLCKALGAELAARNLGDGTDVVQNSNGETWQLVDSHTEECRITCGFLHRHHPAAGSRIYIQVTVSLRPGA